MTRAIPFRRKLILGIAAIQLTFLSAMILDDVQTLRRSSEDQLVKRAAVASAMMAAGAKDAVLATDLATLDSLVAELMRTPDLAYVRVRAADGGILAAAGNHGALARPFVADTALAAVQNQIFNVSHDITAAGQSFGRIELGISVHAIEEARRTALYWGGGMAFAVLALVALFSSLLGTYLTRGLDRLRQGVRSMEGGVLGTQVAVVGKDELAELTVAFNHMSATVAELYSEVRASHEHYETLVQAIPVGVFETDAAGACIRANPKWRRLVGVEDPSGHGDDWTGNVHPDDRDAVVEGWNLATSLRQRFKQEFRFQQPDGGIRHVLAEAVPMGDDLRHRGGFVGTITDISAIKRAEEALADHAAMLARQHDNLKSLNEIATLTDVSTGERLAKALALGARQLGLEIAIISKVDGNVYTVLHHAAPPETGLADGMTFELGSTYCAITLASDTVVAIPHMARSEYRGHPCYAAFRLEAYLGVPLIVHGERFGTLNFSSAQPMARGFDGGDIEFTTLLARWVAAVLERATVMADLARSNSELEQFAYVASHDLRQPLRMITSYLGLIEKRIGPQLGDDTKEFLGFAVDGAKRLDRLILDLLEYSRIDKSTKSAPVPLAKVLDDAILNLTVAIRENDAEIVVADAWPTVKGDATELTRLFQNLIGNAVKYRAPERRAKVEIGCRRQGRQWLIAVKDNGIGIAPDDHDRAFAIFQRLVTQGEYDGTGIGLAVCKKIVEHHGGTIWIESAVGHGSTFFLTLPA